jgi:hypothetical protein
MTLFIPEQGIDAGHEVAPQMRFYDLFIQRSI